jgi:hypothetical protein
MQMSAPDPVDGSRHRHRDAPNCGYYGAARVRSWLQGDIQSPEIDFRFAPKSGHPRWNVCFSVEGMLDP